MESSGMWGTWDGVVWWRHGVGPTRFKRGGFKVYQRFLDNFFNRCPSF